MVKVLMISNNLKMNGISSVIMNYIRNIDRTNLQIDIIAGQPVNEGYCEELEQYGCHVYKQDNRKQHPFQYYRNLISIIKENKYDCIHVHTNSCACIIELTIAKLLGVNMRIAHCHSNSCQHMVIHKLAYPLVVALYTDGIACSKEAGIHLFRDKPFTVLNNGIDVEKFAFHDAVRKRERAVLNIPDDAFVIGHVGLFNDSKNQGFLIKVFEKYYSEHENAYLVFVGSGALKDSLKEEVHKRNLEQHVLFMDERQNVNLVYNAFDCFCFPSKYEGFGIVLAEAQANGLPCIASTGVPSATDFSGKVIYLDLNAEEWAAALHGMYNPEIKYINMRKNDSECNMLRISQAGYDIKKIAHEMRNLYFKNSD